MGVSMRFFAYDTMLALLCRYLMNGTRDVALFNPATNEKFRKINADNTDFKIVRVVPTQDREKPGVNLVFFDDHRYAPYVGSDRRYSAVAIHIYKPATENPIKDERTVLKIVRKVDEALYGGAVPIYNFDTNPATATGPAMFWRPKVEPESWLNQTNLKLEPTIHYAKNFSVWWDEGSIQ